MQRPQVQVLAKPPIGGRGPRFQDRGERELPGLGFSCASKVRLFLAQPPKFDGEDVLAGGFSEFAGLLSS